MRRADLIQVDPATGEQIEGLVAVLMPKRRNGFGEGWLAVAQNAAELIAKRVRRVEDSRVLWLLIARLDFDNLIQLSQADLAQELEMDRAQVNRAMKRLVELGALLEGPKIGRSRTYRLNPAFGWKGSAKSHQSALRERMRSAGLSVVEGGRPERDPDTVDWIDGR